MYGHVSLARASCACPPSRRSTDTELSRSTGEQAVGNTVVDGRAVWHRGKPESELVQSALPPYSRRRHPGCSAPLCRSCFYITPEGQPDDSSFMVCDSASRFCGSARMITAPGYQCRQSGRTRLIDQGAGGAADLPARVLRACSRTGACRRRRARSAGLPRRAGGRRLPFCTAPRPADT